MVEYDIDPFRQIEYSNEMDITDDLAKQLEYIEIESKPQQYWGEVDYHVEHVFETPSKDILLAMELEQLNIKTPLCPTSSKQEVMQWYNENLEFIEKF